ncbi:MAG: cytochrome P450 [Propylenella sp.]
MPAYPKTRRREILRLLARLVTARLRKRDKGEAIATWLGELTRRYDSPNLVIDLIFRRMLFVSGPDLSAHILSAPPSSDSFVAGTMKKKAMSFLAPHALTIAEDAEWRALRPYNERILHTGKPHPHLPAVLAAVRRSFGGRPVRNIVEIRRRMGEAMLAVVFGEGNAPAHLIDDIQELFAEVGPKTALIGSRKRALRNRFQEELRRLWRSGAGRGQPSLLSLAHEAEAAVGSPHGSEEALVDQIPHWMFTFTNSGSDLLARSLAMILARPDSLARARREIAAAGALDDPAKIGALSYLEACIVETGRLFPPVAITSHRAARRDSFGGAEIPAGTETLQFFPFNNRDVSRDPHASYFRPERWLDPDDAVHGLYPNLFLSGARACPGRTLVMFVEKAALALLIRDGGVQARNALSRDPLPFSFPAECLEF